MEGCGGRCGGVRVNLLLSTRDENSLLKIGDFGFARITVQVAKRLEAIRWRQILVSQSARSLILLFPAVCGCTLLGEIYRSQRLFSFRTCLPDYLPYSYLMVGTGGYGDGRRHVAFRLDRLIVSFQMEEFGMAYMIRTCGAANAVLHNTEDDKLKIPVCVGPSNSSEDAGDHKMVASASKGDSLESVEWEYVLVNPNLASMETIFSSLETSLLESSMARPICILKKIGKGISGELALGPISGLDGAESHVSAPEASLSMELNIQRASLSHPSKRLQLLCQYVHALSEVAKEKVHGPNKGRRGARRAASFLLLPSCLTTAHPGASSGGGGGGGAAGRRRRCSQAAATAAARAAAAGASSGSRGGAGDSGGGSQKLDQVHDIEGDYLEPKILEMQRAILQAEIALIMSHERQFLSRGRHAQSTCDKVVLLNDMMPALGEPCVTKDNVSLLNSDYNTIATGQVENDSPDDGIDSSLISHTGGIYRYQRTEGYPDHFLLDKGLFPFIHNFVPSHMEADNPCLIEERRYLETVILTYRDSLLGACPVFYPSFPLGIAMPQRLPSAADLGVFSRNLTHYTWSRMISPAKWNLKGHHRAMNQPNGL
ncbi:hypothetical protein Taro_041132 [Colocasia esculenta]|uniref:Uncharacterized protein n=1 Tax=Colocasia esculenta TaxID=4460 RepID=A0A843WKR1_COLES|nr:hypothetical protein [Colocasia esculenta]